MNFSYKVKIESDVLEAVKAAGMSASCKHHDDDLTDAFLDDLFDAAEKLETSAGCHQKENGKFYVVSNRGRKFSYVIERSSNPQTVIIDAWLNSNV